MHRKLASATLALFLPLAGPPATPRTVQPAGNPTTGERAAGSALAYAACGLPPLAIAGIAALYGWTAPVLLAFAAGGAALTAMESTDGSRTEQAEPVLHVTAGAVRGALFFPVMTGYAGKKVWGPILAEQIHRLRLHRTAAFS